MANFKILYLATCKCFVIFNAVLYITVQLTGNVASIHMQVMLASSRGIIPLQCIVQYLWNIAWICTSRVRSSPHMRILATEFSYFIQHLNHINICDRSHNYVRASLAS